MERVYSPQLEKIRLDPEWNKSSDKEFLMHSIHAYPAKFPAFIASKTFKYAESEGVNVKSVADIFCGCGTVALEARIHDKTFWGCDINPVATLITRTKTENYDINRLEYYYDKIQNILCQNISNQEHYLEANPRLQYWFTPNSYETLYNLFNAINIACPKQDRYKDGFNCMFSAILKASSKWLTKSIKPQIDPDKLEIDVLNVFKKEYQKFRKAVSELTDVSMCADFTIRNMNFLACDKLSSVDLVITSPPYVTSYEYADLHQLSSLWLGYTEDYKQLRNGTIGSLYGTNEVDYAALNEEGHKIINNMLQVMGNTAKTKSVARYYLDMQLAVRKCAKMLNNNGMAFFVIGDTEYKGVQIRNSSHLVQSLLDEGFIDIKAGRRRISNKLLTPYRDEIGRFSSDKSKRTIYHEEFIISARMR